MNNQYQFKVNQVTSSLQIVMHRGRVQGVRMALMHRGGYKGRTEFTNYNHMTSSSSKQLCKKLKIFLKGQLMMLLSFDFVFLPILFLKSCKFSKESHALILAIKKKSQKGRTWRWVSRELGMIWGEVEEMGSDYAL